MIDHRLFQVSVLSLILMGAALPATAGDNMGSLREAAAASACDATTEGAVRYVDASNRLELCDDTSWLSLASGGVSNINALSDAVTNATSTFLGAGSGAAGSTFCTTIGINALSNAAATNANWNTAIGYEAMKVASSSATNNVAVGQGAAVAMTDGDDNTVVGSDSAATLTTGINNTIIGSGANITTGTFTNAIVIGYNASGTASNRIVLGNTSIAAIYAQVTSITGISDERLKKDIQPLGPDLGMAFLQKLRPVSYRYNNGDDTLRYGFIAQDTEEALPPALQTMIETTTDPQKGIALLNRENDEDRTYRMNYSELIAPLVKAAQERQAQIDALKAEVAALKAARR